MGIPERGGIGGLAVEQNDGTEEGLAVHAPIDVETSLIDGSNVVYNSAASITNTGPIEFLIPRDNECSFILNQTRLSGHFIVTGQNYEPVSSTDNMTLVNHFASVLFSQVEVYLNGTQVCDLSSSVTYPWKMFFQSYLSYGLDVKTTTLGAEGYYEEKAAETGLCHPDSLQPDKTPSLNLRRSLLTHHKKVYFNTRLAVDLFLTDRFLPPNIDIKIKLVRSPEKFGILHNERDKGYKIILQDLKLQMRKVLPTLQAREQYKARLLKEPCYLPFKSSRMRHYVIPQGVSSVNIPNIATGILPKTFIFAMIHNQAISHEPNKNPFNFQHFDLNSFNLKKNGQLVFPKPHQPNFAEGDVIDLYRHLLDSIGISHGNQSIGLTLQKFVNGRTFLAADLTPCQCNSYHAHPDTHGTIDIELGFAKVTPHPIYLLAYSVYNSGIKIDQNQQVTKGAE